MDDLTSEGHDLLLSKVVLSDDDVRRGCESMLDLESGLYNEIDKLSLSYSSKIKRLDLEGPFEAEGSRTSEGVTLFLEKFFPKTKTPNFSVPGDAFVKGDGVTTTCDAVTMTDMKKPLEDDGV
ncbi:hypothetical protein Tco_0837238 [Tanacetum coccineum]